MQRLHVKLQKKLKEIRMPFHMIHIMMIHIITMMNLGLDLVGAEATVMAGITVVMVVGIIDKSIVY
jgi:hypothetical protein